MESIQHTTPIGRNVLSLDQTQVARMELAEIARGHQRIGTGDTRGSGYARMAPRASQVSYTQSAMPAIRTIAVR
jgi:hypothetical protein